MVKEFCDPERSVSGCSFFFLRPHESMGDMLQSLRGWCGAKLTA